MVSDGRAVDRSLEKYSCLECGAVSALELPTTEEILALFSTQYVLYAHSPGYKFENARQQLYAEWISRILSGIVPQSISEIGCGNGSLLREISKLYPRVSLRGLEPNEEAVRFGQLSGLDVQQGILTREIATDFRADVVLSVNVLEHVPLPLNFLRAMAVSLGSSGIGILICPDGGRVSSELLIYDHFHSYTRTSLSHLLTQAGLTVQSIFEAPAALGEFQAVLFTATNAEQAGRPRAYDWMQLHRDRANYLSSWLNLEHSLTARMSAGDRLGCFGVGEAADLIATYAPGVWQRVAVCTADEFRNETFRSKPIVPYTRLDSTEINTVLLGVRPASQPSVAERLTRSGYKVIRWDDLVAAQAEHAI